MQAQLRYQISETIHPNLAKVGGYSLIALEQKTSS